MFSEGNIIQRKYPTVHHSDWTVLGCERGVGVVCGWIRSALDMICRAFNLSTVYTVGKKRDYWRTDHFCPFVIYSFPLTVPPFFG